MSPQTSRSSDTRRWTVRFATLTFGALTFGALALGACVAPDLAAAGRPCSETAPCGPGTYCSAPPRTCVPGPAPPPADAGPDTAASDARVDLRADLTDAGGDAFVIVADAFTPPGPWVAIPPGSFTMGSPSGEACRLTSRAPSLKETQHVVTLTHGFEIMALELTEQQHETVMGTRSVPSALPKLPVSQVSWHQAAAYCNELSLRLGLKPCYVDAGSGTYCAHYYACSASAGESCVLKDKTCRRYVTAPTYVGAKIYGCPAYRLPTEAEWEYAYRAGTTAALHNGKELDPSHCYCSSHPATSAFAWYCSNSFSPQGGGPPKLPNAWGLYNMAGNVTEWVHDPPQHDLGSAPVTDPVGVGSSADHIIRGSDYKSHAAWLRAAQRHYTQATNRLGGLRCVRTLKP